MSKDLVTMKRSDYLKEHKSLISLLDKTSSALKKEGNKQKKEVADERRRRKAVDVKSK